MTQMNLFDKRAAVKEDVKQREPGCTCHLEEGDSPCPKHPSDDELTIDQRFDRFATSNPHVLTAALQIARDWLERGDTYISTKAILENLRVQRTVNGATVKGDGGFRLNNDFSAPLARWLIAQDKRLDGVLRLRERKSEK